MFREGGGDQDVHRGPGGAQRQDPDDQLRGLQVTRTLNKKKIINVACELRTSHGEDEAPASTSRVPCTTFLSRFFRSPETSILEVTLSCQSLIIY